MYNWAPGEMLFAMECNGDLLTHKGKLMRFVLRYLEDGDHVQDIDLLEQCGLNYEELSEDDMEFIRREIRARSPSYIN